jgi:hypothetical protein
MLSPRFLEMSELESSKCSILESVGLEKIFLGLPLANLDFPLEKMQNGIKCSKLHQIAWEKAQNASQERP